MSGTLSGAWRDDTLVGIDAFCNELAQLYETLIGEAKLYSHDKFRMTMTAFPRGGVAVEVYVTDHDSMSLTYSFNLDQTHLPNFALISAAKAARSDPGAWLGLREVYGSVAEAPAFRERFVEHLAALWRDGTNATLARYLCGRA